MQLHRVVAPPDWRDRLTVRIATHRARLQNFVDAAAL
jgi:hypothetical protein